MIHRDVKPSNVFLARTSEADPTVKVLDFGLAAGDPSSDNSGKLTSEYVLGSPAYMSPEQMVASSDVDPRSDVWSMGATLYELVTGRIPDPGRDAPRDVHRRRGDAGLRSNSATAMREELSRRRSPSS